MDNQKPRLYIRFTIIALFIALSLVILFSLYTFTSKNELNANILVNFKENSVQILYKAKDNIIKNEIKKIEKLGSELDLFINKEMGTLGSEKLNIYLRAILSYGDIKAILIQNKQGYTLATKIHDKVSIASGKDNTQKLGHYRDITITSAFDKDMEISLYFGAFENTQEIVNLFSYSAKGYNYLENLLAKKFDDDFKITLFIFLTIILTVTFITSYTVYKLEKSIKDDKNKQGGIK